MGRERGREHRCCCQLACKGTPPAILCVHVGRLNSKKRARVTAAEFSPFFEPSPRKCCLQLLHIPQVRSNQAVLLSCQLLHVLQHSSRRVWPAVLLLLHCAAAMQCCLLLRRLQREAAAGVRLLARYNCSNTFSCYCCSCSWLRLFGPSHSHMRMTAAAAAAGGVVASQQDRQGRLPCSCPCWWFLLLLLRGRRRHCASCCCCLLRVGCWLLAGCCHMRGRVCCCAVWQQLQQLRCGQHCARLLADNLAVTGQQQQQQGRCE